MPRGIGRGDLLLDTRTLTPGHQIHWYRIESVLGQGGFGVTYLAHDTNLDRHVAIKEYLPTTVAARHADNSVRPLADNKREDFAWGLDNFLAEARTLARFRHENIVGVHSVFEENNTAYMVMAYEQGASLASLYRRGEYRDQASLERVFFPIFDGLGEIHRLGFVHRDIKPANIYIREDGTAVLLDFGAARLMVQQQTGEMTSLVSQGYTPLEQYSVNYGEQGPWTDIYALAASMHEGITGRKPEEALSRSACLLRRRPDPVSSLSADAYPGFDARFLEAVSAGLALQPEERPADLDDWLMRFRGDPAAASATRFGEFDALDEVTRLRPRAPPQDDDRTLLRPTGSSPPSLVPEDRMPTAAPGSALGAPAALSTPRSVSVEPDSFSRSATSARSAHGRSGGVAAGSRSGLDGFDGVDRFGEHDAERRPLDPPTYRDPSSTPRGRERGTPAGGRGGRGVIGALAAALLLSVLGGATWWFLDGAPGEPLVVAPAPALVDSLPAPREPLVVTPRSVEVARRLDDMSQLAALYRQADAAGVMDGTIEGSARALRDELGALALEWHPQRHASIVGRIERVAALLPERVAERSALQRAIGSADERSDLDAARALLETNAIVEPAGASLIDRIGRLGAADYRTLSGSPAWASMMGALGNGALERVRAADFDGASLLVRAALTLQPDDPFMRRLGEHLGGIAAGS